MPLAGVERVLRARPAARVAVLTLAVLATALAADSGPALDSEDLVQACATVMQLTAHLQERAVQLEKAGRPAPTLPRHLAADAGLDDKGIAAFIAAAVRMSARVAPLDQRAAVIVRAIRLEYPNGRPGPGPMPSPPPELYELQRQRNQIVQESVRGLEVELGPAGFAKFAGYLKQRVPQDPSPPAAPGPAGARPPTRAPRTFEVMLSGGIEPPESGPADLPPVTVTYSELFYDESLDSAVSFAVTRPDYRTWFYYETGATASMFADAASVGTTAADISPELGYAYAEVLAQAQPGARYGVSGSLRLEPYFCMEEARSEPAQPCRYRFDPFRYGLLLMSPRPAGGAALSFRVLRPLVGVPRGPAGSDANKPR